MRSLRSRSHRAGSTFVIVLWIAFGLVSLTLYFAHAMSLELRASDNRVSALAADEAIDGAVRYVTSVLATRETNGILPDAWSYISEAGQVGDSRFWLIGRSTNGAGAPDQVFFGLIDEASKLNLNSASSNLLIWLPGMTIDLTEALLDWRNTNGGTGAFETYYGMARPPYQNKSAPFETIDELRLLYGADMEILVGEEINRNGVLDPGEVDYNRNGYADPGILEYVTVYSREPNTYSNGTARINIRNVSGPNGPLPNLLRSNLGQSRANSILTRLGLVSNGPRPPGPANALQAQFASPLDLYRRSGMTPEEFAPIADALTTVSGSWIEGRVNINTASATVLSCLPGLVDNPDLVRNIVSYRDSNPTRLTSVAWLVDALGQNNASTLNALQTRDCLTTASYQFTADIAAVGPYGRGYRRVRFVFDTSEGAPKILYRQDLTHLGWALGKGVRQYVLTANNSNHGIDRLQ